MEFKGTKGKWHFDKEKAKVFKDDGNTLCVCYHTNIINKKESEPNALLISKAPEMLEMLKELVKQNTYRGYGESEDVIEAKELIKEATQI
jgi:hypothetical protein